MASLSNIKIDKKLYIGLMIVLGATMLLPEYISPFLVFGLYIYFLIHFKKTGRNAKIGQIGKAFMVYMIYMVVSGIWSNTHILSSLIGLLWMGCFLFYILVGNIVNTKDKLKNAITAVNISAGVVGLIGIAEFVTYNITRHLKWFDFVIPNPLFYKFNDFIFDLFPFEIVNNVYPSRAAATFDNPLIMATYLVMVTPFCAFGSVYFKHATNRLISRICLLLSLGGIICTESRGAYVAIGLAIFTMLMGSKKVFKKLFPFVVILAISLPIVLVIRYKNSPIGDLSLSKGKRFSIWACCLKMFASHPIFGLGAGTENIHILLRDTYNIDRTHAHNLFLEMLVEGGAVGAIMMIVVIVMIVKCIVKLFKVKGNKYRPYAVLYTASLIGFTVMSLIEHTLQSPKEMLTFFMLIGFVEATSRMANDQIQLADDEKLTYEEINESDYITDSEEKKAKEKLNA